MSALEWEPLADEDLERELRGVALGRREAGEQTRCGRYLVAMFNGSHPLHAGREELYGRAGESWAVKSSHGTREAACKEAERQAEIERDRASKAGAA